MNSAGNLGTGDLLNRATPAAVAGARVFAAVAAGAFHTCALATDGVAFCWGLGQQGQLGVGSQALQSSSAQTRQFPCATTPVQVAGSSDFRQLDTGFYHTCAVAVAGALHCWGLNQSGQLAIGATGPEQCPTPSGLMS